MESSVPLIKKELTFVFVVGLFQFFVVLVFCVGRYSTTLLDIVNTLCSHPEEFPQWHTSPTAALFNFEYGINKSSNISLFISNLFLFLRCKTLLSLLRSILQGYCFFIEIGFKWTINPIVFYPIMWLLYLAKPNTEGQ